MAPLAPTDYGVTAEALLIVNIEDATALTVIAVACRLIIAPVISFTADDGKKVIDQMTRGS